MNQNKVDEFLIMYGADDAKILTCDGYEDSFLGIVERVGQQPLALYDKGKMLGTMMTRDKMTYEQALEFFDYNVKEAWAGEGTPAFATLVVMPASTASKHAEPDMPLFPGGD